MSQANRDYYSELNWHGYNMPDCKKTIKRFFPAQEPLSEDWQTILTTPESRRFVADAKSLALPDVARTAEANKSQHMVFGSLAAAAGLMPLDTIISIYNRNNRPASEKIADATANATETCKSQVAKTEQKALEEALQDGKDFASLTAARAQAVTECLPKQIELAQEKATFDATAGMAVATIFAVAAAVAAGYNFIKLAKAGKPVKVMENDIAALREAPAPNA